MKRLKFFLVLFCGLALAQACSDNVKKGGGGSGCPEGQVYDSVLMQCVPISANNGGTNNGGTNNGGTNNGGTNNGGTNNGGTNNGGTNNGGTNNGGTNNGLGCGVGTLIGKACSPDGGILAAADITVTGTDCEGNDFEMTGRSAGDGVFEMMDVPAGRHDMTIESGSFNSTTQIIIQPDQTTDLTSQAEKYCVDSNVDIAVVGGAYDHVEGILEGLNLSYDPKGSDGICLPNETSCDRSGELDQAVNFLKDSTATNAYDVIFINCGELYNQLITNSRESDYDAIVTNLQSFVQQGGSLYTSDWAHPFIEGPFPNIIEFYGDDATFTDARFGAAPQSISADVVSNDMQTLLSSNAVSIEFPHEPSQGIYNTAWVVATGADSSATVHIKGDASLCGEILGQPDCSQTGSTQMDAPLLVTYKNPNGGTVIFTSFHNERQGAASTDIENILRFLILQL